MIEFKLQHKVMHVVRTVSRKVVFGMFREETVWLSQRVVGHRRGKSEREAQTKSDVNARSGPRYPLRMIMDRSPWLVVLAAS